MILCYPENAREVESYTTFQLIRARLLLPTPNTPSEMAMCRRVKQRLGEVNHHHRERLEEVIGYGPA